MSPHIQELIDSGRYTHEVPYRVNLSHLIDPETTTVAEAARIKAEYKVKQKEQRVAYELEKVRIMHLFKADLEKEYRLSGHPRADKLFELSWDFGRRDGIRTVAVFYERLTELVDI